MKQTKKKLGLKIETVRRLADHELAPVAGGIATEATSCEPTFGFGCHLKTPNCPM